MIVLSFLLKKQVGTSLLNILRVFFLQNLKKKNLSSGWHEAALKCKKTDFNIFYLFFFSPVGMPALRLQRILEKKYDIREKVVVEGKFVALTRSTADVISLVCIGVGLRCFMVAAMMWIMTS